MDLTALIACKDREANLLHCLASINKCTPIPKVLLVDYGSKQSLQRLEDQYEWLNVIRVTRNTKFFHKARALNIGLRQITTPFFCATDADQLFQPNFFSVVSKMLQQQKRCIVLCRTYSLRVLPNIDDEYFDLLNTAKTSGKKLHGEGCCMGLPTQWLRNVGGWDESYVGYGGEDSDIILRARLSRFRPIFINRFTTMIHLPHPKNTTYYSKNKL